MRIKVTIEPQPREFIQRQAPEVRKQLRDAIHALENGEIFPEPLEDELEGFYKLKVKRHRLIVQSVAGDEGPFLRIVFAESNSAVIETPIARNCASASSRLSNSDGLFCSTRRPALPSWAFSRRRRQWLPEAPRARP